MDRRNFFGSVVGAALLPLVTVPRTPTVRFHRFDRASDTWVPTTFDELQTGWEVWIEQPSPEESRVVHICGGSEGRGYFEVDYRIDPKTNEWV